MSELDLFQPSAQSSFSPAAQVLTNNGGSRAKSNYFDHRRANINDLLNEYIKIVKPVRPEDGGDIKYENEFQYGHELDGSLRDRYGTPVTHNFVAVEGDILEINFGGRQGTYNNKLHYQITTDDGKTTDYKANIRCRTVKAEIYNRETNEKIRDVEGVKPVNFLFYSMTEYQQDTVMTKALDRAGIELYGRPDPEYIKQEGLQDRVNEEGLRSCRECIANGWNVFGEGDKIDRCSPDGEVVMLVRRLAFVGHNGIEWRNVEDFGIDTIQGPFVCIFDGLKGSNAKAKKKMELLRIADVVPPQEADSLGMYQRRLYSQYANIVKTGYQVKGFDNVKDIIPVPTEIWIFCHKGPSNARKYGFLFNETYKIDETLEYGLKRVAEAWAIYRYERAIAAGETVERPQLQAVTPNVPVVAAEVINEEPSPAPLPTNVVSTPAAPPSQSFAQPPAANLKEVFFSSRTSDGQAPTINLRAPGN